MKRDILMLSALSFVLFMLFANAIPIIDGDSAFYATISKNIIKSGDWITLKFVNHSDIIDKPPLFMWAAAASFKLFGANEFALSLPHSLFAIGIILFSYLMAKEAFGRRAGLLAGFILMLSAQFFYICRTPMLDIPLTFFVTWSIYSIFKLIKTENKLYYYPLAAACALGLLIKGPVALAIPGTTFAAYMVFSKKFSLLSTIHFLLSIFLFFAIAAPWFIIEYRILGQKFADIFFARNLFRFLSPTDIVGDIKQIAPQYDFYSYFIQIFLLFAPWSGFVYPAIFASIKKQKMQLFLIWAATAVFIFAFSLNYKIGRYILPAFPALAIIVAVFLDEALDKSNNLRKHILISAWLNIAIVIPILTLGTVLLIIKFPAEQAAFKPIALPFLTIFSIGLIVGTILLFLNKIRTSIIAFIFATTLSYIIFITTGAIFLDNALPTRSLCREINKSAYSRDIILINSKEEPRREYFYIDKGFICYVKDFKDVRSYLYAKDRIRYFGITQDKRIKNISTNILREVNGYYLFIN